MGSLTKTWTYTKHGAFAGYTKPVISAKLLDIGGRVEFVAENNWLRRFLYWIGAPRWMTRAV